MPRKHSGCLGCRVVRALLVGWFIGAGCRFREWMPSLRKQPPRRYLRGSMGRPARASVLRRLRSRDEQLGGRGGAHASLGILAAHACIAANPGRIRGRYVVTCPASVLWSWRSGVCPVPLDQPKYRSRRPDLVLGSPGWLVRRRAHGPSTRVHDAASPRTARRRHGRSRLAGPDAPGRPPGQRLCGSPYHPLRGPLPAAAVFARCRPASDLVRAT